MRCEIKESHKNEYTAMEKKVKFEVCLNLSAFGSKEVAIFIQSSSCRVNILVLATPFFFNHHHLGQALRLNEKESSFEGRVQCCTSQKYV